MTRALVPLKPQQRHETREDVDFQVSIKVRNGRFLGALKRAGHASVYAFCKKHGLPQQMVNQYATMTLSPINRWSQQPTKLAQTVADILNTHVDDLFPPRFLGECLNRTARTEVPMTEDQIAMLIQQPPRTPEDVILLDEAAACVSDTLILLPPREERLLRLRYGMMGTQAEMTLEECGEQFNVTRERIRQMELKALRKLKHPKRRHRLVEAASVLKIGEFTVLLPATRVSLAEAGIQPPSDASQRRLARELQRPLPAVQPMARRIKFPPVLPPKPKPAPIPDHQRLLGIPATDRTEEQMCALAYHLEQLMIQRGAHEIRPHDDFIATWKTMNERQQQLHKHDWFMRNWTQIWQYWPPAP